MTLRFIFRLLLCLCGLCAHAAHAEVLALQRFQAEHGLINVHALSGHPDGHIWVGTQSGLFLFNGLTFTAQEMPSRLSRDVRDVIPLTASQTWVLTTLGVWIRQDTAERVSWHEVTLPNGSRLSVDGEQRIVVDPSGAVRILDNRGRLWRIKVPPTLVGDLRLPEGEFIRVPDIPRTGSMGSGPLLSDGHRLWMGCSTGLCSLEGEQLSTWGETEGLPKARWAALLRGRDGTIWARSSTYLARLDSKAVRFKAHSAPREEDVSGIMMLAQDAKGRILVSGVGGIARWDGITWQEFGVRNGVPDVSINALHFGGDGSLWIGTGGAGLLRWPAYDRTKHWSTESGLPGPTVWNVLRDGGGRLVVGTSRGVGVADKDLKFRPVLTDLAEGELVDSLVADRRGHVWWIQSDGLYRLAPHSMRATRVWASGELLDIHGGRETIYVRTRRDFFQFYPMEERPSPKPLPSGLPMNYLNDVFSAGGREWLVIGPEAFTLVSGQWKALRAEDGPFRALGDVVVQPDGRIWMTDPRGLSRHSLHGERIRLDQLIEANDLGTAEVRVLDVDRADRLWAFSERGALMFDSKRWLSLGLATGLLSEDLTGALLLDDEALWIGSTAGLTRLDAKLIEASEPRLEIQQVRVNGQRVSSFTKLRLPAENSTMQVTLSTRDHGQAYRRKPEYRWGTDAKWHPMQGDTLELASLAAGHYELEFRLAEFNGLVEPSPSVRWTFEVAAPWWRAPYTVLSVAVLLMLGWRASLTAVRRRAQRRQTELEAAISERTREVDESRDALRRLGHRNVRLIEDERLKLARELHDELGQELIALRIELSLAALAVRERADAVRESEILALRERVGSLIHSVRRVVTALRPFALDGGFESGIRWLVAQLESRGQAKCSLTMDWQPDVVDQELETAVFRIVQEALNNVAKHTSATSVDLRVTLRGQLLDVQVTDNGGGFTQPSSTDIGFGLMGMRERALMIGAAMDISEEPGRGVSVHLRTERGLRGRGLKTD